MQKFQINQAPSTNNQNKFYQSQDPRKLFHQLKQLNQIQDQSRNQLCPVFLDEQSFIRQRKDSHWTNHEHNQTNLLKQYQETQQQSYKNHQQPFNKIKRSYYETHSDINLKDSNKKLLQDNKKLFNQCIRLRKICQKYQGNNGGQFLKRKIMSESQFNEKDQLMKKNMQLLRQNEQLKKNNDILQQKMKKLSQQIQNIQFMNYRCDKMSSEINILQKVNDDLNKKVIDLQKQLEVTISRKTSRSNQSASINNSTQQSRKSEVQMDRKISNLKLVYENQIKKLKNVINQLKKQLSTRGSQSSFSNAINY